MRHRKCYCGEAPEVRMANSIGSDAGWYLRCAGCFVRTREFFFLMDAVDAWNEKRVS